MTDYISIDWGGTHLNGVILNSDGIVKEFELPSCNLKLVSEKNLSVICSNILKELNTSQKKLTLLIGAAGVSNDSTANKLKNTFTNLSDSIERVEVYPDYLCNHAVFLNGEDGILSINGTGSILFGIKGKKQIRLGGWGYVFDETPSGAFFGKKYLECVLMSLEGSKNHQYYSEDFKTNYDSIEREELLNQIYSAPSIQNYLGNYSKDLIRAYENGEPNAKEIIDLSIAKLSQSIFSMVSFLGLENPNFCGSGGLWKNWKDFKNLLNVSCEKLGVQLIWKKIKNPLSFGPIIFYSHNDEKALKILNKCSKDADNE